MLDFIVKWSIAQRWLVVIATILISVWGFHTLTQMPLDVLPNFAPPQVEIQTEAPGLAPEEVESVVTLPIESAVNGTPGVTTVRSSSAVGISVVKVIFNWETDIYQARQLVTERLQQAQGKFPEGVSAPQISPISSPIGTVIKYAFTSKTTPLMEVRRIIDWQITNRLRAVPGVTQVIVMGGDVRQYQVLIDPEKLASFDVSLADVSKAVAGANANAPGGFLTNTDRELLVRSVGRIESIEQLQKSVITERNGTPIFALSGVEGRIFTPLGVAYLLSVIASTVVALTLTPAMCALLLANCRLSEEQTWVGKITQRLYRSALMFALRYPQIILVISGTALIASLLILPTLGRVFLPEFQERSLVIATNLYPGVSLDTTNRVGLAIEDVLKDDQRFDAIQMRAGRAPGDTDAGGVNFGEMDLELSETGLKDREAAIETLRTEFGKLPGVVANVGGFISDRFAEVLSGVRAGIAVKIYGADFTQLRNLGRQVQSAMSTVEGVVDLQVESQVPVKQVQIKFDREAADRYGLTVGEFSETIATALNGRFVSQVLEQQQLFDLLVWLEPNARQDLQTIRDLLIDSPKGQKIPLATIAKIDYGIGSNTINRENVSRRILVSTNVSGRDLRSVVNEIQEKIKRQVQLPSGYFIEYGGQFEAEERATQSLIFFGGLAFIGITVLIYLAVKSIPATVMIMVNLPLALIGGVISIAMADGIISVASMVGFITLFGVAIRNGLLLVENYNHKLATGMPLHQVLIEGSSERVTAILMTALSSAVGIVPLVIGGGAGKEILQPLSVVVLGGLFSSTALTLLVIPASYAQFRKFLVPRRLHSQKYAVIKATSQET